MNHNKTGEEPDRYCTLVSVQPDDIESYEIFCKRVIAIIEANAEKKKDMNHCWIRVFWSGVSVGANEKGTLALVSHLNDAEFQSVIALMGARGWIDHFVVEWLDENTVVLEPPRDEEEFDNM